MISFPVELTSVSWEGLSLKTPVWNFSGFFPGVEQGARIGSLKNSFSGITLISPPIVDELSSLYTLVPLSDFSAISDFFDILDIIIVEGIMTFGGIT